MWDFIVRLGLFSLGLGLGGFVFGLGYFVFSSGGFVGGGLCCSCVYCREGEGRINRSR